MQGKVKTCFLYVRVSTKMQAEQGESIDAQIYELERYARAQDVYRRRIFRQEHHGSPSLSGNVGSDKIRNPCRSIAV